MFIPPKLQKANPSSDSFTNYSNLSKKYMKYSIKYKKSLKPHKNDQDAEFKYDQNLHNIPENINPNQKAEILKWLFFSF